MSRSVPTDVAAFVAEHERKVTISRWALSYMFFPCEANDGQPRPLLVCLGGNGSYSYMRSFYARLGATHHLLYLSDNLGPDRKGLWFLADWGDFGVGDAYAELIGRFEIGRAHV